MSWKNLIFAGGDKSKNQEKSEKPVEATKEASQSFQNQFPVNNTFGSKTDTATVSMPTATPSISPSNPACAPHMDKIMSMYEQGFDGLNQAGYDFYEYFKSVIEGGVTNPMVYTMAFSMGKVMEKNLTKESLISQSNFYITEIQKVHQQYVNAGNQKKQQAISAKTSEETTLNSEILSIDAELKRLGELRAQKMSAISQIDNKYQPEITEIECKLMANDMAKDAIVGSIQTVVNGIKTNVQ